MAISAWAGIGRPVELAADDVHRGALDAAGVVEFLLAPGDLPRGQQEQQRVLPEGDGDLEGLVLVEGFLAVDAAVLARRDVDRQAVLLVDHGAVGAHVHPALVRVLGHDHVGGADVAAAVLVVPLGHRQLQHVEVLAGEHVLVERALVHVLRRDQCRVVEAFLPGGDELVAGDVDGQVGGEGGALERLHHAHQHPVPFGIVLDVVEQQRGGVLTASGHLRQGADLQVPVAAGDPAKLAHGVHLFEPLSQVGVGHGCPPFCGEYQIRHWCESPPSTPIGGVLGCGGAPCSAVPLAAPLLDSRFRGNDGGGRGMTEEGFGTVAGLMTGWGASGLRRLRRAGTSAATSLR